MKKILGCILIGIYWILLIPLTLVGFIFALIKEFIEYIYNTLETINDFLEYHLKEVGDRLYNKPEDE